MARNDGQYERILLNYNELPEHTKYRFAEIEIGKALNALVRLTEGPNQRIRCAQNIFGVINPNGTEEALDEWLEVFSAFHTIAPLKEETIVYFLHHNVSYTNIRKLTNISPNTISKYRFHNPFFYPRYRRWNEYMLDQWDRVKDGLNIWGQDLVHLEK